MTGGGSGAGTDQAGASRPASSKAPASGRWRAVILEAGLILTAALLYSLVRGLTNDRVDAAFDNADRVIAFQRALGIYVEVDLQQAIIGNELLVRAANTVYIWGYWPVLVGTLAWLLVRHRSAYTFYRNALLASGALSLVVFALFPLAPPRFLPEQGFVDTISEYAPGYRAANTPALVNEYAAMPSLHFGWILLLGISWITLCRHLVLRIAGVVYPFVMFAAIVLTGNHFFIDGVVGAVVVLAGLAVAAAIRAWAKPPSQPPRTPPRTEAPSRPVGEPVGDPRP